MKWLGAQGEDAVGQKFLAKPSDESDKRSVAIMITDTHVYQFKDLPARHIAFEHMKECVDWVKLKEAMQKAYRNFSITEYVTVVFFFLVGEKK